MTYEAIILNFLTRAAVDSRLGSKHVTLYIGIVTELLHRGVENEFNIARGKLMEVSKISSRSTYNKCLKELNSYGYINYLPSFKPGESKVGITKMPNQ